MSHSRICLLVVFSLVTTSWVRTSRETVRDASGRITQTIERRQSADGSITSTAMLWVALPAKAKATAPSSSPVSPRCRPILCGNDRSIHDIGKCH
jgi:hypothetical protein